MATKQRGTLMSFYLFLIAAAICFLSAGVHGIWGRGIYLGFIEQTNLPTREKTISAVTWDIFTIMLLVSGGSLGFVAFNTHAIWMAYPIMLINLMGAGVFFAMIATGRKELIALPGAYLMTSIGVLTLFAI
jgi:hypothetical protein